MKRYTYGAHDNHSRELNSIDYILLEAAANYSATDTMTSHKKQMIRKSMIDDRVYKFRSSSNVQRHDFNGLLQIKIE